MLLACSDPNSSTFIDAVAMVPQTFGLQLTLMPINARPREVFGLLTPRNRQRISEDVEVNRLKYRDRYRSWRIGADLV